MIRRMWSALARCWRRVQVWWQVRKLRKSVDGLKRSIGRELVPVFQRCAGELADAIGEAGDLEEVTEETEP